MFAVSGRNLWRYSLNNFLKYSTIPNLNEAPSSTEANSTKVPDKETLKMATVNPPILKPYINPIIAQEDPFNINNLIKVEEMFNARVHFGHKMGTLQDNIKWALFGERLDVCIFDLEITQRYFTRALNFLACMSYQGAIIMFITTQRSQIFDVERLSESLSQYSHTRRWQAGTFTDSRLLFGAPIRLPDVVVFFNTLTSVLEPHPAIIECAKMAIPTIAIVDSNSEPNYITYPIPGNDDSKASFDYYVKMFQIAVERGAKARLDHEKMHRENLDMGKRKSN